MRRRLGAIHADSVEQFIQKSQLSQELPIRTVLNAKSCEQQQCEDADKDTNTSTIQEEIDNKEYLNINILIVDNCNQIEEIFKYCDTPIQQKSFYHLEYCSKIDTSSFKQNHFHFWIINQESPKYSELINVYFAIADVYIYLYHKSNEQEFQGFREKVRMLNKNQNSIIYKVINSKRISVNISMNNFQDEKISREITLQSLEEVIKRVKDQYF